MPLLQNFLRKIKMRELLAQPIPVEGSNPEKATIYKPS